jgi:2-dehydro-3-deoxygluconokinase
VELGGPPRGVQVTYDRAGSDTTLLSPAQINWDALMDSRLLHMTGITPALSDSCREIAVEALRLARQHGLPICFDINYRQKLWTESRAFEILRPMIQDVEILLCSRNDAMQVFACGGATREIAEAMQEHSRAKTVVITLGQDGAALWDGKDLRHEPAYPTKIVDRLGAGDALAAGIIEGWLEGGVAPGLRYGVTLAALALSQLGDMVTTTKPELVALSQKTSPITR